ncbi:MAG: hypothetical protein LBV27_09495 [Oscillospiraceae bacterium]|jgi:hypothetical protein|nr:hypothetical protein [Oscillospiraceae bacterium]
MKKSTSAIVTTTCVGMAMGAAAYMMSGSHSVRNKTKKLKKSTGRALRQAGEFINNVSYMIK